MPYEILKHTADVRLQVWGKTKEELFEEAAYALLKTMQPEAEDRHVVPVKRRLAAEAGNITELLIDFLNRILTSAQTNKETYTNVRICHLNDRNLESELNAVRVKKFGEDIKAVTYHEAEIRQKENGKWETLLVLDI